MARKKKVLIVNRSSHDFSQAEIFGDLTFMSEGSVSRFSVSKIYRLFQPFIDKSNKTDYILLTSMNILCSIACGMFGAKHGRLNLLLYDPRNKNYLERIVVFNERKERKKDDSKRQNEHSGFFKARGPV